MKLTQKVIRLIFPKTCKTCRKVIPYNQTSCSCDQDDITLLCDDTCEHCGNNKDNCVCSDSYNIFLDHICAVYIYRGKIKQLIIDYKFYGKKELAKKFAPAMYEKIEEKYYKVHFDYISFVPMFDADFYVRGYNQSRLLARYLSNYMKVPFKAVLKKTSQTQKQHKQSGKDRRDNLKGSFSLNDIDVTGKTILICDDIKSTGATLRNCCDVLKENGAKDVYCVCIAVSDFGNLKM